LLLPFFFAFAVLTIGSALAILLTRQLLHAAFALLLTFLGVAALYVLTGADFLAVTQVMIYVGGVLVLLIFGVMLTQQSTIAGEGSRGKRNDLRTNPWLGFLVALSLFGVLLTIVLRVNWSLLNHLNPPADSSVASAHPSSIPTIGMQLMTEFALPFEIAAILLMVALIGAAYIASRKN
jgi:NADH:ubiquinone oxidoreductase subunit 6 (subunit J)